MAGDTQGICVKCKKPRRTLDDGQTCPSCARSVIRSRKYRQNKKRKMSMLEEELASKADTAESIQREFAQAQKRMLEMEKELLFYRQRAGQAPLLPFAHASTPSPVTGPMDTLLESHPLANDYLTERRPLAPPPAAFPRAMPLPSVSDPPAHPELHASKQSLEQLMHADSVAYWQKICPELHIGDDAFRQEASFLSGSLLAEEELVRYKARLTIDGYYQVPANELCFDQWTPALARSVVRLVQHGWPPSFVMMYDEVWAVIERVKQLMKATSGNELNFDVLAWYVDPNQGQSGFSPHRDRQPDDTPSTFRQSDGSAMYTTCWIPFTDACPDNSCLYMIPRWADPGYYVGDSDDNASKSPLEVALDSKEAYQNIRALPAAAGSAVVFTHRQIHWGRKGYHTPRISLSIACADDSFEPPYLTRDHLPYPPTDQRFALACAQMLVYHERFGFDKQQLRLFHDVFTRQKAFFHPKYAQQVLVEFVSAAKESAAGPSVTEAGGGRNATSAAEMSARIDESDVGAAVAGPSGEGGEGERVEKEKDVMEEGQEEGEEEEEELMDKALDAMLEARMQGYEGFEDDFDAIHGGGAADGMNFGGEGKQAADEEEEEEDSEEDEEPLFGSFVAQ